MLYWNITNSIYIEAIQLSSTSTMFIQTEFFIVKFSEYALLKIFFFIMRPFIYNIIILTKYLFKFIGL